MVEMVEPQGVPCKMLRGNPFETYKIDTHDWSYNFIQNVLTMSVCKTTLYQNNPTKLNLLFDFKNNLMFV